MFPKTRILQLQDVLTTNIILSKVDRKTLININAPNNIPLKSKSIKDHFLNDYLSVI